MQSKYTYNTNEIEKKNFREGKLNPFQNLLTDKFMLRIEWYSKNYPSLSEILSFQVQDDQRSRMHLLGEGSFAKVFLVKFKAKSFKFLP